MSSQTLFGFFLGATTAAAFWMERNMEVQKQRDRKRYFKRELNSERKNLSELREKHQSETTQMRAQLKEAAIKLGELNGFTTSAKESAAKQLSLAIADEIVGATTFKIPEGRRKRKETIAEQISDAVEKWIEDEIEAHPGAKKIESTFKLHYDNIRHPIKSIYDEYIASFHKLKEAGFLLKKKITVTPGSGKLN